MLMPKLADRCHFLQPVERTTLGVQELPVQARSTHELCLIAAQRGGKSVSNSRHSLHRALSMHGTLAFIDGTDFADSEDESSGISGTTRFGTAP